MSSTRVRLLHDLTEYHPALRAGVEGLTVGEGRFGVLVRFSDAGVQDILWKSLDIIDEEYLRIQAERTRKTHEALKTATDVELHLGPRGGFRHLSYHYIEDGVGAHVSIGFRNKAQEVLAVLEKHGIPVREVRER